MTNLPLSVCNLHDRPSDWSPASVSLVSWILGWAVATRRFLGLSQLVTQVPYSTLSENKREATSFMITISGDHSDWIHRIHWVFQPLLPHLICLTYVVLPVLRPAIFVLPSQFRTATSLFLWVLESQSFREVLWFLNQFPNLQRLQVLECTSGPTAIIHLSFKYNK